MGMRYGERYLEPISVPDLYDIDLKSVGGLP